MTKTTVVITDSEFEAVRVQRDVARDMFARLEAENARFIEALTEAKGRADVAERELAAAVQENRNPRELVENALPYYHDPVMRKRYVTAVLAAYEISAS